MLYIEQYNSYHLFMIMYHPNLVFLSQSTLNILDFAFYYTPYTHTSSTVKYNIIQLMNYDFYFKFIYKYVFKYLVSFALFSNTITDTYGKYSKYLTNIFFYLKQNLKLIFTRTHNIGYWSTKSAITYLVFQYTNTKNKYILSMVFVKKYLKNTLSTKKSLDTFIVIPKTRLHRNKQCPQHILSISFGNKFKIK